MLKRRLVARRVIGVVVLAIACVVLAFAVLRCIGPSPRRYRTLGQEEAARVLKRFTGRQLPSEVEAFQAILFDDTVQSREPLPTLYLAFQTDEQGCSYVLNEFRGPNVRIQLSSEQPLGTDRWWWNFGRFFRGCDYQNELGVLLFDRDLLRDIQQAQVANAQFPEAVHYVQSPSYGVLVLADRRVVYLYAWDDPAL